ncbi:uncharacterized protein RHIMIDRAFT_251570 [Rhizopus microsporus ATCC 52813]|uniref:Uncharacterized protein n=1 Tax=Rhizopus microsporus ATCC 52813 TaxID=1340429 RepID=A0A2G4SW75_RHIZD|nr:uncharacterized protein RHIMIDRAFT_251570 [Rhizopus microsporus ATCC 52813]PHZ12626.1 hypothetical protein RHIMIDRAFT_251570 [Rhizopus microsporus ATCC 52813]
MQETQSNNYQSISESDKSTKASSEPLNNPKDIESSSTTIHMDQEPKVDQDQPMTWKEKLKTFFFYAKPMIVMLVIDVGIPLAIYYGTKDAIGPLIALIISGIPPLLHVIYSFVRHRRLEILGCIFVVSFIVSAVLSLITGDVRLTLLRDSSTTALISVMFFVTLIPLQTKWFDIKPMMFANAPPITWVDQSGQEQSSPRLTFVWEHVKMFRTYCYALTFAWAVILMGEFAAKVIMIKSTLDVDHIVLYGNIIIITVSVAMALITSFSSRLIRKRSVVLVQEWMKENNYRDRLPQ